MTTLTVNIGDKKKEKAIKALLDALELDYSVEKHSASADKELNSSEQEIFERLKRSAKEIRLFKEGKIELQDANDLLNEL